MESNVFTVMMVTSDHHVQKFLAENHTKFEAMDKPSRHRRKPGVAKFRCSFRNTIYDVLRSRGWRETDSDTDVRILLISRLVESLFAIAVGYSMDRSRVGV